MKNVKKEKKVPNAWIVNSKDRGRKAIKNGNVYLPDKFEFEIELFNPLQDCVLADIKLNGNSISKAGLVLNPGQRFYLDCFIDDNKKFIFNTYNVDDTDEVKEAIINNGMLEVFFYKESVITLENWNRRFDNIYHPKYYPYPVYPSYPWGRVFYDGIVYGGTNTYVNSGSLSNTTTLNSNTFTTNSIGAYCNTSSFDLSGIKSTNSSNLINCSYSSEMETGRVEKGNKSNQKFETIDMDFDKYYIAATILQLLPESRKPIETKEIKRSTTVSLDSIVLLEKLGELHKAGVLTDEEFTNKKEELLSKI